MANRRRSAESITREARVAAMTLPRAAAEAVRASASRVDSGKESATVTDLAVLGGSLRLSAAEIYKEIA